MKKPEVLAIIPARGGSKGIPRKNIRLFAGHPLIAYSIAAGLQAETVTRVIVTTDDPEIAEVSRNYGAEVPFMRPPELAEDRTLDLPVFQHALAWLSQNESNSPDVVVHLRPTTPIRPPGLVDKAVQILLENPQADSVRGITPAHQNPYKMWLMEEGRQAIQPLVAAPGVVESYNAPRQALPQTYAHTGLMDVIRSDTIKNGNSMSGRTILPVMFDPCYDIDLDTMDDWRRAEERLLQSQSPMVWPGKAPRSMPDKVKLLVLDFDGVLTDNRVWVDQDGREMVAANRSDGLWLGLLKDKGVLIYVLSKETNPVVTARCKKLKIPCIQGEDDKRTALGALMTDLNIDPVHTVYCGNDLNDLPCFPIVGWAVAVADAVPEVLRQSDYILTRPGGFGAVRELCELIINGNRY